MSWPTTVVGRRWLASFQHSVPSQEANRPIAAIRPMKTAGRGPKPEPEQAVADQRQRQGGDALRRGPGARAAVRVGAQPVGVAQGVPGPAQQRPAGQQSPQRIARSVRLRLLRQRLQLHLVDRRDARRDQRQRRQQLQPGQPCGVAAVGHQCDHHRQRADDHGRQRPAGALDRRGQEQVIDNVAHQRQLQRVQPVAAAELRQPGPVEPGQRQGDQAEGQVTAEGLQGGRVLRQQQGADKHQAPHQAGSECKQGSDPHDHRSRPLRRGWRGWPRGLHPTPNVDPVGSGSPTVRRTTQWSGRRNGAFER